MNDAMGPEAETVTDDGDTVIYHRPDWMTDTEWDNLSDQMSNWWDGFVEAYTMARRHADGVIA